MYFDERDEGPYRIYAGAVESGQGDGYVAAVVVHRLDTAREAWRDTNLACGHRWTSPQAALKYAMGRAQDVIRSEADRLAA